MRFAHGDVSVVSLRIGAHGWLGVEGPHASRGDLSVASGAQARMKRIDTPSLNPSPQGGGK